MNKKLLTIAIPTFNRATEVQNTINKFIALITKSNMTNLVQIIVSDNCSSDNTYKILEDIHNKYPDSIKINKNAANLGFGANLDWITQNSNSEYVWTCGDDDNYYESSINSILEVLTKEKPDFCFVNYEVQPEGQSLNINEDKISNNLNEFFDIISSGCKYMGSCIFKTDIIRNTSYNFEEWYHVDKLLNYPINAKFYILSKPQIEGFRPKTNNWFDHKNFLNYSHKMIMLISESNISNIKKRKQLKQEQRNYFKLIRKAIKNTPKDEIDCSKIISDLEGLSKNFNLNWTGEILLLKIGYSNNTLFMIVYRFMAIQKQIFFILSKIFQLKFSHLRKI